jgi:hypothetical protein
LERDRNLVFTHSDFEMTIDNSKSGMTNDIKTPVTINDSVSLTKGKTPKANLKMASKNPSKLDKLSKKKTIKTRMEEKTSDYLNNPAEISNY